MLRCLADLPPIEEFTDDGAELIAYLEKMRDRACSTCGNRLCAHHLLASAALGTAKAPRCFSCLARAMDQPVAALASTLYQYYQARSCYTVAWQWACKEEQVADEPLPSCLASLNQG